MVGVKRDMLKRYCDFDEHYYAYYSDLEMEDQEDNYTPIYIGGNMGGKNRSGKLFVLSGPSGVGKTTLANELFNRLGKTYNMHRVITYTTKAPRKGERNGIDYHFVTESEFQSKLANGFFIEYSQVYGCYYGSPKSIIRELANGKSFLLIVDQAGAYQIKEQYNGAVLVWITPPSMTELVSRLKNRATDLSADIEKRLIIAASELETEQNRSGFDYIVENNVLELALTSLTEILKAEILSGSTNC